MTKNDKVELESPEYVDYDSRQVIPSMPEDSYMPVRRPLKKYKGDLTYRSFTGELRYR